MELKEIEKKIYQKYWNDSPYKTFLSAPEIALLREQEGWKSYFLGLYDEDKLVGATLLVAHPRHLNKVEFYAPRGFLVDYHNNKYLDSFVNLSREFVKQHKGYVLRIDPYLIYHERDIDGNIVEGGVDNSSVVEHLKTLGFKKVVKPEQVTWMFSLDLEGKTKDDIMKEMKPNVRNIIRKALKFGIDTKELTYEELDKFQNIMIETGARKGFGVRKITYFQEMYKLFHDKGEVKYFISTLNLNKYIEQLELDIKERQDKIASLSEAKYNDGAKTNLNNEVNSLEKRVEDAKDIIKSKNSAIITLSGSMFMLIKPEIIYLSSGNYEEFMKFNAQYLIQWQLIQYGIDNGFKKHNFYGIPEDINTHPKDYGIYEFKRGFNGYVEELIGEYELPISKEYYLINLAHKMRG